MATWPSRASIRSRLARRFDPVELRAIKQLWVRHSIAEDARDIDGLIATLAPDCVYEVVPTGQRWEGHDGARAFYTELFAAFPDNRFSLTDIVVGPQGVFEAAELTGTNLGPWAGVPASGLPVSLQVLILFPWDPAAGAVRRRADLVRPRVDRRRRNGPVSRRRRGWRHEPRPADSCLSPCSSSRSVAACGERPPSSASPSPADGLPRLGAADATASSAPVRRPADRRATRCRWSSTRTSRRTTCSRCSTCSATLPSTCAASRSRPPARCTACPASATPGGSSRRFGRTDVPVACGRENPGTERPLVPARVARRRRRVLRRGAAGRRRARPRATRPPPSCSSGSRREPERR